MADDERLREALLELQVLRDREAKNLIATQTLLNALEAFTSSGDAKQALRSVFVSLEQYIGAEAAVLLEKNDGGLHVVASSDPALLDLELVPPVDILSRTRNVTDLSLLGAWGGSLDVSGYSGSILSPASENHVLLCFRTEEKQFKRDDTSLVERLSGLAVQALQNSRLAAENELLAASIEKSSSGFAIADATDPKRPLVYVNKAFEELSGYSAEEVLGENCRFLSDEPKDSAVRKELREAVAQCREGTFLLRNKRKNGEPFWNELTLFPVSSPDGSVRHLVATQTDVTARVSAASERDHLQNQMTNALSATDDAFLVLNGKNEVTFANDAVNKLFPVQSLNWKTGTSFEENWSAYLEQAKAYPMRTTRLLQQPDLLGLADAGVARELDLPDGSSILLRARRLDDEGLVISATEITAMKLAQKLLAQRLAAIEAAGDGIAVTDEDGRILYQNSSAANLLGFRSSDAGLGLGWQSRYAASPRQLANKKFSANFIRGSGVTRKTHEVSGSPISNGGMVIVIRDITDNLKTEAREEELLRELVRLQRQEAIAQLTAGIAHDFNNLLSTINGSVTLIDMLEDMPVDAAKHLQRISKAGSEAARLTNRLLDIGAGEDEAGIFDVRSAIKDLPSLLSSNLGQNIEFVSEINAPGLVLRGSPGTLTQMLVNMVLNSADSIGSADGKISLKVSSGSVAKRETQPVGILNPKQVYACFEITDTGTGMDKETAQNIFRPYFTTKGRQGTGLGLATAAMQIQAVGGAISLETEPDVGTTIRAYWPTHQSQSETDPSEANPNSDLRGQTIIVVDDDRNVAEVIAGYLENCGAEIAICEDPRDALEAVQDNPTSWSALITDYDMPNMNGGELVELISSAAPDLKVFVVTALAKRLSDPRLSSANVKRIFSKPVNFKELTAALAETTD